MSKKIASGKNWVSREKFNADDADDGLVLYAKVNSVAETNSSTALPPTASAAQYASENTHSTAQESASAHSTTALQSSC